MTDAALLDSRAVLRVSGPDARAFLQGVVTQDVAALKSGEAAFSALLSPQGKILFDFIMVADGDGFLIDVAADAAEALAKRLALYKLRANVAVERTDRAVAAFWGGAPPETASEAVCIADPRLAALGWRCLGARQQMAALAGPAGGEDAYQAHRLALGVPEFGKDFAADEVFLLDVDYDALGAVSYSKGCFVGQEVSSRMKRKGDVRKRTLKLCFDGAPAGKGTPVTAGDSRLGAVLSGAGAAALALVRLDRLAAAREAGAPIKAGDKSVNIVFPDWLKQG